MSQTVKVKMDEVANSIAMIADYKAAAELRIATLATQLDKYEKQLLDVQSQLIDRNTELFNERECTHTLNARVKALETLAQMICKASMGESRMSRGESLIGWQQGDGATADEVKTLARNLLTQGEKG